MSEPASWLSIRPGWKVVAAGGEEIGEVDLVTGDETQDIFNGLAVATTALGKPRYVEAEQIAEITPDTVRLSLTAAQAEQLPEYLEPATSAEIEADNKTGFGSAAAAEVREVAGEILRPPAAHERPMTLVRRIAFLFKRRVG